MILIPRSGVCKELQGRRVSVNNIAPGPMDTRTKPFYSREIICANHPSLLLPPGIPRGRGIPQGQWNGRPADAGRGHCPHCPLPVHGWHLDHRPDHLRQRWIHYPLNVTLYVITTFQYINLMILQNSFVQTFCRKDRQRPSRAPRARM